MIYVFIKTEVLLNSRSELLVSLLNGGILHVIGDIIVSETDPLVLVCLLYFFIDHACFFFITATSIVISNTSCLLYILTCSENYIYVIMCSC